MKWSLRSSLVEQSQSQDLKNLVEFRYNDLPHLFDDREIDHSMYDCRPVPRPRHQARQHRRVSVQHPALEVPLHPAVRAPECQAGPYEITRRWTMVMTFVLLPWKPQLVFTGVSMMGDNPKTQKLLQPCGKLHFILLLSINDYPGTLDAVKVFCFWDQNDALLLIVDNQLYAYHAGSVFPPWDCWDSIENNDYFSLEGFLDILKQLRYYKTPDLESPKYQILRKRSTYEVRKYEPFLVVDAKGDELSGSSGFNEGTGLPDPNTEAVKLRKVEGGIAAAMKFSGKITEELVCNKEKELHSSALLKDGLRQEKVAC